MSVECNLLKLICYEMGFNIFLRIFVSFVLWILIRRISGFFREYVSVRRRVRIRLFLGFVLICYWFVW